VALLKVLIVDIMLTDDLCYGAANEMVTGVEAAPEEAGVNEEGT
jgi:hypothetical protein